MAEVNWIAPEVARPKPPTTAGERAMLEGWLDWQRATLLWKCAGLSGEQLSQRTSPPSGLSLLGLVRHMAEVERAWFRRRFAGEAIGLLHRDDERSGEDFDGARPEGAEADFASFAREVDLARAAAGGHDLDETFRAGARPAPISLRWVYVHMIEEYARHNGHADLLRERIDGAVGA